MFDPHPEELALASVSKDEGPNKYGLMVLPAMREASSGDGALRLLTMRV